MDYEVTQIANQFYVSINMNNVSNVNLDISRPVLPWGLFPPVYKEACYLSLAISGDQFSPENS